MSRKKFIESQGATCRNWNWSWSFINDLEKFVIFGAWDTATSGGTSMIFAESWEFDPEGRRKDGYKQSLEHIHLVESGSYRLKTFPIIHADLAKCANGSAKIQRFVPVLTWMNLKKEAGKWYASSDTFA